MLEEMAFCVCVRPFMDSWKPAIFPVLLSVIRGPELHSHKAVVRIQGNNVWEKRFENGKVLNKWRVVLSLSSLEFSYTSRFDGSAIISNPSGNFFFFFFRTRSPLSY